MCTGLRRRKGRPRVKVDLPEDYGYGIRTARAPPSEPRATACGLSKRQPVRPGRDRWRVRRGSHRAHNLEDEAGGLLFGNVTNWQTDYLGRQLRDPCRRASPARSAQLVRPGERESIDGWTRIAWSRASTTSSRSAR